MSKDVSPAQFMKAMSGKHLIFFDGVCGLCDRLVQWVVKHDVNRVFCFASLQSVLARTLSDPYGIQQDDLKTLVLVTHLGTERESVYRRSKAVGFICRQLPGFRWIGFLLLMVPTFIGDIGYRIVAFVRYRLFGVLTVCSRPKPEDLDRFFIH